MLADLYRLYKTLGKSGVFYPDALWATAQFLWSYLNCGSSLTTLAKWAALRFPNHKAIVDENRQITFRELVAEAERLATGLEQTLGIKPNQTIGLLGRNSIDLVETLLACEMLGVTIFLLHTNFAAGNLEHLQQQSIDLLICDDEFRRTIEEMTKPLPNIVYFSSLFIPKTSKPKAIRPRRKSNIIMLTSGTTGHPKAIKQRPRLTLKTLVGLLEALQLKASSRTLLTIPLLHGHGLATLALSLAFGAALYVFRKSQTEDFVRCLEENNIETIVLVPTILYRLLQEHKTFKVEKIISGSAPLDEKLALQTLETCGSVLYNLYGSSEAGLISLVTPSDLQENPGTVGKILPGVKLRFEDNHIQVMQHKSFHDTGDVGYLDDINNLFLLGRSDDLLICGGENVYPRMIEEKVNALSYVLESAVIGVPNEEYGQAIHLFVVLKAHCITKDRLEQDLKRLFSKAIRPQKIFMVDALPKTSVGKVAKHQLVVSVN
jgi:acyl-CoA synthetase (AMP-forming)/AMP-acid ligase II